MSSSRAWTVAAAVAVALAFGCAPQSSRSPDTAADERLAPRLEGMGDYSFPITTSVPEAQRFFDQGMVLTWGFNHAEAGRAFREAARLDPECAMCWWGAALVLGPNINAAMEDEAVAPAWEALEKARTLAAGASERERAYIEALGIRYAPEPVEDRSPLDVAYAAAMSELAARYADDADAATLLAESLMDLHPWDFWTVDGEAQPWTAEIVDTLESVLEDRPDHPGANHLLIHALEASPEPARAEAAADRLGDLAPGAGHLVHMPSHVYIRVGRYDDAAEANRRAIQADEDYVTQCHAQGIYPLAYMPHNRHFLWAAASMAGRGEEAIRVAREMAERIDTDAMRQPGMGTLQHFWITPLYAQVRFGRWDEVLATSEPDADLIYPRGVWHYARALARIAGGDLDQAEAELEALRAIASDPALEAITIWDINGTVDLLTIAADVVAGELSAARGDLDTALAHFDRAVAREDALKYDEPPTWHLPVRQSLGAVLLAAGDAAAAEAVYRRDLERHPANGWALNGLIAALRAQGKDAETAEHVASLERTWAGADVETRTSRIF